MELNDANNIKNVIKEYRKVFEEPIIDLSSKLEVANSFEGSFIAETIKGHLEHMINDIQKMTTFLDSIDEAFDNSMEKKETVEVTLGLVDNNVEEV